MLSAYFWTLQTKFCGKVACEKGVTFLENIRQWINLKIPNIAWLCKTLYIYFQHTNV